MTSQQGYYRHPTIHRNTIAFVSEDDLWCVPADGGLARRLTANPGTVSFPRFSPDGTQIAVTGRDEGPNEVFVLDANGGPLRRLTWIGAMTQVAGWRPDGKEVLIASDWRQPFMKSVHLFSVPLEGGHPMPLNVGPARAIANEPGGKGVALGRNSGDPARWKRYRGGTAGTLWIDRAGRGEFAPLVKLNGNLANPMWIGERVYFLSDHEGIGNLYSCTPTGRGLKRHTHHEDFYVRFPSADGERIVYHAGADIFVFDPGSGASHKVQIDFASPRSQRNRKFVNAARYLESYDLHPQGHSLASIHRGGLYTMGLWEGAPLRLGKPSGARYRLAGWLPDGKRIVAVTDEGGEEGLVVLSAGEMGLVESAKGKPGRPARGSGARPISLPVKIPGDFGRPVSLVVAPAGADRVALSNQRQEVILVDLASRKSKTIERSPYSRIEGLAWSPDGRWLAYGFANSSRTSCIHICEAATGKVTAITRPDFQDLRPAFDPDGRYLYFLSYRVFDPVYDSIYFDLGFPKGMRPYLLTLTRDGLSPFSSANRAFRAPGPPNGPGPDMRPQAGTGPQKKEEEKEPARVEIDFDGIEDRVVAFPVPEGNYGRILGAKNRALFTSFPVEGSLDANFMNGGEPPAKGILQMYNFEEDKTETAADKVTDFTLSLDRKVLGIRSGNRLRVAPVGFKIEGKPLKDEPGRESGWLDLERLRVSIIPGDEWRQMYNEAWRLQRDQFWTPDMSGLDWAAVHRRYLPLVDRVASRAEFSDLMWEMQGELGTSHCYELGGDYRPEPTWHQGFLGADLERDRRSGAWRVARIPRGDSWDEKSACPLTAPGLNVREGDEILAVAGQPVDATVSPYERLVHHSGREVQLTVRSLARRGSAAKPGKVRTVVVKTLREEYSLRYRDFVEANRAWVGRHSKGQVGYVHIPNMGPWGYAEFHRYYLSEVDKPGLIIDVRFNGGGHVSQLLLEKLVRRRVGYDATRWGAPVPYPMDAPMGPMVALTNEYAGSDGDIFSHCFKLYGLGPLIGKRTWGGVVGIWPRHALVDGTVTTQPEFAFWFKDVGWEVENYGTDPDIEVEIRPQDYAKGRDPQMERSLLEVQKLIHKMKPKVPEFKNRPRLGPGALPKAK